VEVKAVAALAPGVAGDRDVGEAGWGSDDPPQRAGTSMAEDGTVAAGEDGGHPLALLAQSRVAHCVDPAVDAVEALRLNASAYAATMDANA
jgi:hypothetical protein